jgi:UDP-GlcNAc:undecaprenyl-phosphate/decaprenyl-phosphate GlcNAc-1-phosphate transferase
MYSLLILTVAAFCMAFILTPLCRNLAIRRGVLDRPDRKRKIHSRPIPRIGGIPIVIAYIGAFALLLCSPLEGGNIVRDHLSLAWKLLPAAMLVFLTGLLDDFIGLKPWQKLLGQLGAAVTVCGAGVHFTGISGYQFSVWWTLPATLLWLVGCTNAFNLLDGLDGLAAGVGFFATITTLVAALLQHNIQLALATAPLAGALLGFLRYNLNPATIFLGDCGSLLIGFLLGCHSLVWSEKSVTVVGMTAPLMVLAIPLLDTSLAIVRRFLRHQPIFGADLGHIHHKLLARGLTPHRVVLLVYGICGIGACLSLLQSVFQEQLGGAIIVIFSLGTWMGIQRLGYAEFDMARHIVLAGTFRRVLNAELKILSFRDNLMAAKTPDQCWKVLDHAYKDFGFNEIELNLSGRLYTNTTNHHRVPNSWALRIALSKSEYLNLFSEFDTEAPLVGALFADMVGKVLRAKLADTQQKYPASDPACSSAVPTVERDAVSLR